MTVQFTKFCKAVNDAKNVKPFHGTLLSLDPGETTGWSVFRSTDIIALTHCGQKKTWPQEDMVKELTDLFNTFNPTIVVMEIYAVYEWKAQSHSWSEVPTLHVIGCIETLCIQRGIPFFFQSAQIAKAFCTDERLQEWGMYIKGQKHARDAIRHGTYALLFGTKNKD